MSYDPERYNSLAVQGYKRAKTWIAWRYFFLLLSFICLVSSVKTTGAALYATTLGALVFFFISWLLNQRQKAIRDVANALSRQSLLLLTYRSCSPFKLSHLFARAQSKQQQADGEESGTVGGAQNLSDSEALRLGLIALVHENCYWNHHQYRELSVYYAIVAAVIFLGAAAIVIMALPLHYLDPDYIAPRMAFSALSFTIVYEVMEHAIKLRTSSKEMLELDNELDRNGPISEDRLIDIYTTYVSVKESTPDIPELLYQKNRDKLNEGWTIRNGTKANS
jgi:hypothetical protein